MLRSGTRETLPGQQVQVRTLLQYLNWYKFFRIRLFYPFDNELR